MLAAAPSTSAHTAADIELSRSTSVFLLLALETFPGPSEFIASATSTYSPTHLLVG